MPATTTGSRKKRYREVWTDEETFATSLLVMAIDTYGTEATEWDPRTLKMEIEDDFNVKLPRANADRLMVAVNILTGEDFYKNCPDFIAFCNVLSGDLYDTREWDPADASEIAWGITEAMVIEPPDEDDEEPFSDDIRAYIGHQLDVEGIMTPPDVLGIAIRDVQDLMPGVQDQFTDDPTMFAAISGFEADKVEDIDTFVRGRLGRLARQLEGLPVASGNTAGVVMNVLRSIA